MVSPRYKFIVDGDWRHDGQTEAKINDLGQWDNVVRVSLCV